MWVIKRNLPPGMICIQLEVWQWCGAYETIWIFLLMVYFSVVSLPAIGRTLIPRYFSTVFEGGVTDLYYILKHSKESYHSSSITVDWDSVWWSPSTGSPCLPRYRAGSATSLVLLWVHWSIVIMVVFWNFNLTSHISDAFSTVRSSFLFVTWQDPMVNPVLRCVHVIQIPGKSNVIDPQD